MYLVYNHKFIFFILFILIFCCVGDIIAQNSGTITGYAIDVDTNQGIPDVMVQIAETDRITKTDSSGYFFFTQVSAATYSIILMKPGFGRTVLLNVELSGGRTREEIIYMQKSPREDEQFYIGGIAVTADRELIPDEPVTSTRISSGEIEHIQASSLGDIVELIPGQKFTNPGLEDVKQLNMRHVSTDESTNRNMSFGTQVVVDDVPISNNANMQIDTDLNDGATYRVTVNNGVDLRQVPAENIKSVEVIRGIPPARYGDLTSGAILVETKSGYTPIRAKYKYNLRTQELNAAGGYSWTNHQFNFNANYARTLRDIRVEGDSYSRLALQFNLVSQLFDDRIEWTNRFYFTRTFDDQDLRQGDITQTERYNRDFISRYTTKLQHKWSQSRTLNFTASVNLDNQDSYIRRIVSQDIHAIGTRLTPGVEEGRIVSSYISELNVKGRAWNLFAQAEYADQILSGRFLNKWLVGIVWRNEFNNGPGREFDPAFPPRSNSEEADRPRPYDDIPGLQQLSFYLQDEMTADLFLDFSLQFGLRYDIFGFRGINFSGDDDFFLNDHGDYLNPRINLVTYLTENSQLRLGYGRTAKTPPISMIYPNPAYFDVVDSLYYISSEDNFSLINTQIFDRSNKRLQAEIRSKYEISFDHKFELFGFSLTGFYEELNNGFETGGYNPVGLIRYSRPNWPQAEPAFAKDTILADYRTTINSVESITRGLEFSLRSKEIPYLNTTLRIDAAYHISKQWWQDNQYTYATIPRFDQNLNQEILPFWSRIGEQAEQLVIHYRFDTVVKPLKLWFTIAIQQISMEKDRRLGLGDSLAVGYVQMDGTVVKIPEDERADEKYKNMRRVYSDYQYITESKPNLWLINLRVSKELWKGSELSFFVNNLFDYRPLYKRQRVPAGSISYTRRNPEIFYGVEFSMVVDDLVDYIKRF